MKKRLCILTLSSINFSYAATNQVQIASTALPTGMSQAQYDQLLQPKISVIENIKDTAYARRPNHDARAKADAAARAKAESAHIASSAD